MYAAIPTPLLPYSSKPQHPILLPLKPKTPSPCYLFLHTSPNNCNNPSQLSLNSNVSTSCDDKTLLLNDWPQLLKISINSGNLNLGLCIHGFLLKLGFRNEPFQGNNLINMYAKFGILDCAQQVFDEMPDRNTITWTSLINGYAQINDVESVFGIAFHMHRIEEEFNEHTWSVILRACESPDDRIRGEQIHGSVIKTGFCEDVVVRTSLISMYSRCGYLEDAERLFIDLSYADVRCFNLMISEYGRAENSEKAIGVFLDLINCGLEPNDYTLTNVLSTCNGDRDVEEGKQLHGLAVKHGVVGKTSVGNAVITMYGKHGLVEDAENMFRKMAERNLVTWTALISAYVKNGDHRKALRGFLEMVALGVCLDSSCFATVLDGCSENRNLEFGLQVHGIITKLGLLPDVHVGTALVDLYAKCGKLQYARTVLNILNTKSIACFNAILAGYTETQEDDDDEEEDAMVLFKEMRVSGLRPDSVSFARLLSLSADGVCLVRGQSLHAFAIKTGFVADNAVGNALITMYAKCGSIQDSYQAFCCTNNYDTISWNALISAYALHGKGEKAVFLFEEMKKERFMPDDITILGVLQACSYSGLWEYGFNLFNIMEAKYGIRPVIEHFACMVDLLGRAGFLSETVDFIDKCPYSDSPLLWRTLVNVCKLCGDLRFGKIASTRLLDLAPKDAGSYILVSNMFAGWGMFDEGSRVRTIMNDLKVSKEAGCSWIEVDNMTHKFLASGKYHPESKDIYAKLDLLEAEMKQMYNDESDNQLMRDYTFFSK
ncbi:hypothetical protein LguiA_012939 [Lonicera macranthoides]